MFHSPIKFAQYYIPTTENRLMKCHENHKYIFNASICGKLLSEVSIEVAVEINVMGKLGSQLLR